MTAVRRIAGLIAVGVAGAIVAVPAAPAADKARVDAAVARGGEYLKRAHAPAANYTGGGHGQGSAALIGLAILEAKVKPDDPTVQNITRLVRYTAISNTKTYDTALAVLF